MPENLDNLIEISLRAIASCYEDYRLNKGVRDDVLKCTKNITEVLLKALSIKFAIDKECGFMQSKLNEKFNIHRTYGTDIVFNYDSKSKETEIIERD